MKANTSTAQLPALDISIGYATIYDPVAKEDWIDCADIIEN